MIVPDQWRGDVIHHAGNSAAVTPNLDKFAETEGVSFTQAYCQNTVCTPSRCSFMTGWYPHVRGHRTMYHMLRKDEPNLLKTMRDSGYYVAWLGKNDLVPGQHGYDDYCDEHFVSSDKIRSLWSMDKAQKWRGTPDSDNYYSFYVGKLDKEGEDHYHDYDWACIERAIEIIKNPPTDKPLFIYVPITYPHPPYAVEDPWFSMIDRNSLPPRAPAPESWNKKPSMVHGIYKNQRLETWTEDRWNELRAVYYGMCARVDHQFGLVVDALKESGMYDSTALFMFSDHGDYTGDYSVVEKNQNTFEDCLSRVQCAVKPPSNFKVKPRACDSLVELIDIPATIEEITGIAPKHTHFGKSLLPLIAAETDEHRDSVFCEGGRLHGEEHCMEKSSKSNQNPEGFYYPRLCLQTQEGPEHTKAVMCRTKEFKYVRRLYEKDEFYDLKKDPQELNNVIDEPAFKEEIMRHKERLLTYFMETGDVVPFDTDARN